MRSLVLGSMLLTLSTCDARHPGMERGDEPEAAPPLHVVVYTRTLGFRHDSIGPAKAALQALDPTSFAFRFTEDPAELIDALSDADVVAFVSTTGDVLADAQQPALEAFIRAGGGFVGVHAAGDTEPDWRFYDALLGAHFASHPEVQRASVRVEPLDHPATAFLPATWVREDEWYNFDRNPGPHVQVLLRVDESTYRGGAHGSDHPIAWCQELANGRSFYTALGHTRESWSDPLFVRHVAEALVWAAKR